MDPRQNPQQLHPPSHGRPQRFSWQTPPDEDAPPYEVSQQPPPQMDTSVNPRDRAFSYAQTPIEHRDPYYTSVQSRPPLPSSPSTPFDQRPQSFYTGHNPVAHLQPQPASSTQSHTVEKTPFDSSVAVPTAAQVPFSPDSFSTQPPEIDTKSKTNHARNLSNLSPINTNVTSMPPVPQIPATHRSEASPLPLKSPHSHKSSISPISPVAANRESAAVERFSPHSFPATPAHAVFSPHSAHGPNGLDAALHQPGQIAHPNMDLSDNGTPHSWKHSLCSFGTSDCSTCVTGLFCPCILYGRTSYRLTQKSDKKDPTDMLGYSTANGHCAVMTVSCGLWWLFPMLQRTRVRHLYKVEGSFLGDLARGCCCCCCVAVQNEREVREREENTRRWAGPASTDVYKRTGAMEYKAQQ